MKLRLLGGEAEEFHAVVIMAYEITDGQGRLVTGKNRHKEAVDCAKKLAVQYNRPFWVNKERIDP